jgi:hypothetical protein
MKERKGENKRMKKNKGTELNRQGNERKEEGIKRCAKQTRNKTANDEKAIAKLLQCAEGRKLVLAPTHILDSKLKPYCITEKKALIFVPHTFSLHVV